MAARSPERITPSIQPHITAEHSVPRFWDAAPARNSPPTSCDLGRPTWPPRFAQICNGSGRLLKMVNCCCAVAGRPPSPERHVAIPSAKGRRSKLGTIAGQPSHTPSPSPLHRPLDQGTRRRRQASDEVSRGGPQDRNLALNGCLCSSERYPRITQRSLNHPTVGWQSNALRRKEFRVQTAAVGVWAFPHRNRECD